MVIPDLNTCLVVLTEDWKSRSPQQKAEHSGQIHLNEKNIVHGVSGKLANKWQQNRRWGKNGKRGTQQEESLARWQFMIQQTATMAV